MDAEKLAKLFPKLEVRNKTGVQKSVLYQNGDSITFNPGSTRTIQSKNLLQIPNSSDFEMIKPKLFDLQKAGIISLGGN